MPETIKVSMAEVAIASSPTQLTTVGLGSCIGIVLYDPVNKIGGLAHIMLPNSQAIKNSNNNKAKFADTAIELMLEKMISQGAKKKYLIAKIFGGANMFSNISSTGSLLNMGIRNIQATKQALIINNIPLVAEDTGANFGRTITLDTNTGQVYLKSVNIKDLLIY